MFVEIFEFHGSISLSATMPSATAANPRAVAVMSGFFNIAELDEPELRVDRPRKFLGEGLSDGVAVGPVVLHEPRVFPEYHPNYYGAFVRDPDGHNVEAVCHLPE